MTEIALPSPTSLAGSDPFSDPVAWKHVCNMAKAFADSALVPEHFRKKEADVIIALSMALRLGENPLAVLQNIHVVKGKAGWSAQYMIARANASGILRGRIGFDVAGAGDSLKVTARGVLADTGETISFTASMEMAKAEGWAGSNPKYRSMPELMLRYRAAAFLVRLYMPEIMLGYQTAEELEDVSAAAGSPVGTQRPPSLAAALGLPDTAIEAAEVQEPARETVAAQPAPAARTTTSTTIDDGGMP